MATRQVDGFVPGINDIINGGYVMKNLAGDEIVAPSVMEKMAKGKKAVEALSAYKKAQKQGDEEAMIAAGKTLDENYEYFGYGYVTDPSQVIPPVPYVFYAFHVMITLGCYFLLLFIVVLWLIRKDRLYKMKWMLWVCVISLPIAYICLESGWIVAEMGRQPWVIESIMPTFAAISKIGAANVQTTFWMFAALFTVLLIAEVGIMVKQIKKGTEQK